MHNNLGYNKPLFILPFDHRSSFLKLLDAVGRLPTDQEIQKIKEFKEIIYEAFKKALSDGIKKDEAAILVDEEYGDKILQDAKSNGFNIILATEKTGQKEFQFEYEDSFKEHIEKYRPNFVKGLIRYNNQGVNNNLKILLDYCRGNGYKLLLEIITENKNAIETTKAISEFQNAKIEPDVWKIEGMEEVQDYEMIVNQAHINGRNNVGIVVLGRGEEKEKVEKWISESSKVKGITGFAVGRTIFWEPLIEYKNTNIEKEQTIEKISNNFLHFYHVFKNN